MSDERATGSLQVSGPSELSEIRIFDAASRDVAVGAGYISLDLPTGVYRVQVEMPGTTSERLVVVEPGRPASVQDLQPQPDSPAPLQLARTTHEYHQGPATHFSRRPMAVLGDAPHARLFLFVRTTGDSRDVLPAIVLKDAAGSSMASLPETGVVDLQEGWAALTLDVPAGTYALEQDVPGQGPRQQAVLAEQGWETQMFVPWDDIPDTSRASIFMRSYGTGFEADRWQYLKTEAALEGLAHGRLRLHPADESDFLNGKFENPMLGLIGAYAYLSREEVDYERLSLIAQNLHRLLPNSADAAIIGLVARAGGAWPPPRPNEGWPGFRDPPMLSIGMDKLMAMAAEVEELIDPDSRPARLAPTLVTGSAWTRWGSGLSTEEVQALVRDQLLDLQEGRTERTARDLARLSGLPLSLVNAAFGNAAPAGPSV